MSIDRKVLRNTVDFDDVTDDCARRKTREASL